MAIVNNIDIYKGEDVDLNFTMTPDTDITGWNIVMTVKNNMNDTGSLLTSTGALISSTGGQFRHQLTHANLLSLGVGNFAYDVQRTDVGSNAVLSIGALAVTQEALYP